MALDLSQAAAFQAIRAKEKARSEAPEQEAAEAARAEAKAGGKRRAAHRARTVDDQGEVEGSTLRLRVGGWSWSLHAYLEVADRVPLGVDQ